MKLKKILSVALAAILLVGMIVPASAATSEPVLTPTKDLSGRNSLLAMADGTNLAWGYDVLSAAIKTGAYSVNLTDSNYLVLSADLEKIFTAILADNPQITWYSGEYMNVNQSTVYVSRLILFYDISSDVLPSTVNTISSATQAMLKGIDDSMSDFLKIRLIHDRLISAVTPNSTAENSATVYGALIDGAASSEGYAKAFKYLLNLAGIPCEYVNGTANGGARIWNIVKLDGNYYHTDAFGDDVTELDQSGNVVTPGPLHRPGYNYFNVTAEQIKQTHTITDEAALPAATATANNYYVKSGWTMPAFDTAAVAAILKANNGYAEIYVTDSAAANDFANQLSANMNAVLAAAEITDPNTVIGFKKNRNEIILTAMPEGSSALKGDIFGREAGPYNVELLSAADETSVASLTSNGSYSFAGIPAGDYKLMVTAQSGIAVEKTLTLGTEVLENYDVFVVCYGDINGDGKFSILDYLRLKLVMADSTTDYNASAFDLNEANMADKLVEMRQMLLG